MTQSEQILEEQLIAQFQKLGYGYITLNNEVALLGNLKSRLEETRTFKRALLSKLFCLK
jgi:hypothetical protein